MAVEPTARLACDIVLLPSEEIADAAVRLNQTLLRRFDRKIVLSRTGVLPHLSLAMGTLEGADLPAVMNLLEEIGSRFPPIPLTFAGVDVGTIASGETVSTWKVKPSAALRSVHETAMNRIGPFLKQDAAAEAFVGFPNVSPASVDWVNRYAEAAAFDRFSPHITLGVGALETDLPDLSLFRRGAAARLALCHLGDYCTCRKILFETTLRGRK